jgi:hypothetical protein
LARISARWDTIPRLFSLDDVVALVTGSSAGIGARFCGSWRPRCQRARFTQGRGRGRCYEERGACVDRLHECAKPCRRPPHRPALGCAHCDGRPCSTARTTARSGRCCTRCITFSDGSSRLIAVRHTKFPNGGSKPIFKAL